MKSNVTHFILLLFQIIRKIVFAISGGLYMLPKGHKFKSLSLILITVDCYHHKIKSFTCLRIKGSLISSSVQRFSIFIIFLCKKVPVPFAL